MDDWQLFILICIVLILWKIKNQLQYIYHVLDDIRQYLRKYYTGRGEYP